MSDPESRVLGMKKLPLTKEELATKTCKRGHTGEYAPAKGQYSYCKACARESLSRHRGVAQAKLDKQVESTRERLAELELLLPRLKRELALAETEYEFMSQKLAILGVIK
jgi:hypothetical protein